MSTGKITLRLGNLKNELHEKFRYLCTLENFEDVISQLEAAKSNRDSVLATLYNMLRANNIPFETGKDNKYYAQLVQRSSFATFSDIENEILSFLYSQYREYPSPGEYMQRIVDNLSAENSTDSLRLRILKRFIEYGNYLSDAGFGGANAIKSYVKDKAGRKPSADEILTLLDDGIFDGLAEANKAQKKPDGKYGLIKLADDLAGGKFRTGGNTRRGLYLFAMVYNMTFSPDHNAPSFNPETDLEKNLFRDYYCNNLMRFISDSYNGKRCEYDMNPSGQGINYKNFAEMIYIYYIASDYSPTEKIARSSQMIERIENAKATGTDNRSKSFGNTLYFRRLYTEDILEMDEKSFESFILDNYNFEDLKAKNGINSICVSSGQNTAYQCYMEIMSELKAELEEAGATLEGCNYGLWFTDVAQFKKNGYDNIIKSYPEADKDKIGDFLELLLAVNDYLGYTVNEKTSKDDHKSKDHTDLSGGKTKALYIDDSKEITRTAIIVAYYYYYNIHNENRQGKKNKRFDEVFGEFSQGLNKYLEASYFQKLDGKSIFDVMVVFSAYAYLNF